MRRAYVSLILAVALTGLAQAAWAFDTGGGPVDQYQEEMKRSKLGPALGVDQQTVEALLQIDRKYRPLKEQSKREAVGSFQQLKQVMAKPSPSDAEVQGILDKMMRNRQESLNLQQRQFEEEMAVLKPVQQAKYLMFLMGLRKQVAQEARGLREGPPATRPLQPPRELPVVRPNAP